LSFSKGASKAREMLTETNNLKLFFDNVDLPKEDVIFVFKLYLKLVNPVGFDDLIRANNSGDLWRYILNYFRERNGGKVGITIEEDSSKLDLSPENCFKVLKLLGNFTSKLTANHFTKICGTTGLFIFVLKDILEYAGIIMEKKSSPPRLYALAHYACEHYGKAILKLS
jgi:hypothetical protein